MMMLIIWQGWDFRVIPIFAIFTCAMEYIIQIKYRLLLNCPHCGFDPILYKQNVQKCVEKVKLHLDKRKNDPLVLLSKKPKLDLPVLKPKVERQPDKNVESRLGNAIKKHQLNSSNTLDVRL